ncbi:MAG: sulfite exporter TauE/SafE family protein [Deltaproteobacteria bacterium]|nr:sulfite exporter TauE/SafE family protein [Deltaproteobacteria bacterium]
MQNLITSLPSYLTTGSPLAYAAVFAGGLLVSFTPCIYPVIPITVGYIGSRSGGSRARGFILSLAYVAGMAVTYAALGGAAALTGRVFGESASSPLSHLVVGNLCLLFGLSLFDIIRIPLPSFAPSASAARRSGGVLGALSFGMASGLVVGPCTAPVLGGLLLFVGSRQNVLQGLSLLFVFALGMGSVLVLLGTFSSLIAGLPRSGKWLGAVKRGFGVVMILAGEYFLVQAGRMLV